MKGLGKHILVEFYGCESAPLNDPEILKTAALQAVDKSGATIMSHHFQTFEPQGVSGVVVIAESHMSFHTWPEYGYVALDYFTCGEQVNIQAAIESMQATLKPNSIETKLLHRGMELGHLPHRPEMDESLDVSNAASARPTDEEKTQAEQWITEFHHNPKTLEPVLGFGYLVSDVVARRRTEFQNLLVARNHAYGRMLFLDGFLMTSEADEFVYHEMLAHVPMMLCESPRRILVVGGGDGGLVNQVLRHPEVDRVDLVEIDQEVIRTSREFFPEIAGRLADPKVSIHLTDGAEFVRNAPDQSYDVILVDSTDPAGPGKVLFEAPFYRQIRRCLMTGGVMAAQSLSPWLQADEQKAMYRALGTVYPHVLCYAATVPTYPSGQWTFALAASHRVDPGRFEFGRAKRIAKHCRYYTTQLQTSAFHLPRFVSETTTEVSREVQRAKATKTSTTAPTLEAHT